MKLDGSYTLTVRGDTRIVARGGLNTDSISYHFQRLLTGQATAINDELHHFGITVERTDKPFIRLTPEDVELMLADSYIDLDLTVATELANLVADRLLGRAEENTFLHGGESALPS